APQRPGRAVRLRRVPGSATVARDDVLDEPPRRLLRQRGGGELLQDAQGRAGPPRALRDPGAGPPLAVRVRRGVLQPQAAALEPGLRQPRAVRGGDELKEK